MIPAELIKKIRALEIKTRNIVQGTFSGEYHSVFKGHGMSFAEVREYQPGDDVRLIDWNVTARTGSPFIKIFEEERELTVILALDISGSGEFGSMNRTKADIAAEIAAILGFSANNNNDKVGLLLFSDQVERYIPPKRGKDHIMRILRDIFYLQPKNKKTSINAALDYLLKIHKKQAIVFLISDFIDQNYDHLLRVTARKHDLIPIIMRDPKEISLPRSGLLLLEDNETGETLYINTNSLDVRHRFKNIMLAQRLELERLFKSLKITPIFVESADYFTALKNYFQKRSRKY